MIFEFNAHVGDFPALEDTGGYCFSCAMDFDMFWTWLWWGETQSNQDQPQIKSSGGMLASLNITIAGLKVTTRILVIWCFCQIKSSKFRWTPNFSISVFGHLPLFLVKSNFFGHQDVWQWGLGQVNRNKDRWTSCCLVYTGGQVNHLPIGRFRELLWSETNNPLVSQTILTIS